MLDENQDRPCCLERQSVQLFVDCELFATTLKLEFSQMLSKRHFSNLCQLPPRCGVPQMHKLRIPLVGAQGYQRFPLSKPVVGQNIAVEVVPAFRASMLS